MPRFDEIFFGLVVLVQLAVDARDADVRVRVVGHQVRELLKRCERLRVLLFREERLAQTTKVAGFGGLESGGLAIRAFGLGEIVGLRVSVAQQIVQRAGGRACVHAFEKTDGFAGFIVVEKKLASNSSRRLIVVGILI